MDPTSTSSETLTLSDFLAYSHSQLDSDQYGLEKPKRRLMEHLARVWLRALIAQAPEVEQVRAQEVALNTIDEPAAEIDN